MRDSRLVYSTDPKQRCPACGEWKDACRCAAGRPSKPPAEQAPRIWLEKGGRGGKAVTVVKDLALSAADAAALLKELKAKCACGGTVGGANLELQGDHRDKVLALLLQKGYKAKKAGG